MIDHGPAWYRVRSVARGIVRLAIAVVLIGGPAVASWLAGGDPAAVVTR